MAKYTEPVRPADDEARETARRILAAARHGALAYSDPDTALPAVARIALTPGEGGSLLTLVSDLARHTSGMRQRPDCAVMVGEPGPRGDPLTHPRLMVTARAAFVDRDGPDHAALRDLWLSRHPKAKLYVDFADFGFVRLVPSGALLNAGFGRAHRMDPADLFGA